MATEQTSAPVGHTEIGIEDFAGMNERLIAFARRVLTVHRGQLPSEIADMYGGGCGCPLCEQALAALSNIEGGSK